MASFGFKSRLLSVALIVAATGCGGVTAFQGNMGVAATPPPPPPPPPAPPPPAPEVVKAPRVEVAANQITIADKVQFELNSSVIKPESFPLLNEVADVIKKNPQIKKLAVEGHASADGDAKMNEKLSDERAKSVRQYLIDKGGIKADMLTAKGYGDKKPIADNKTEEGREKNRRVGFTILEMGTTTSAAPAPSSVAPVGKPVSKAMKASKVTK